MEFNTANGSLTCIAYDITVGTAVHRPKHEKQLSTQCHVPQRNSFCPQTKETIELPLENILISRSKLRRRKNIRLSVELKALT
jgi:hypothetical protein